MLFLVLQRIQDRSEQTLDVLETRAAQLDISKLKGEDVEQAVRLIKSTYRVLKSSSTTTVGRILTLRTGKITPQCHVAHDELFTAVQGRLQCDAPDPQATPR